MEQDIRSSEFVGERIRRLRVRRKLSQLALARATGLSQTTIYRAEVGGVVSPRAAELLALALGVTAEDLRP